MTTKRKVKAYSKRCRYCGRDGRLKSHSAMCPHRRPCERCGAPAVVGSMYCAPCGARTSAVEKSLDLMDGN